MKKISKVEKGVDSLGSHSKGRRGKVSRKMMAITAIVIGCFVITASGALLSHYGKIQTTANISQSVLIDGNDYATPVTHEFSIVAGCTEVFKHKIENRACVEAPIDITTLVNGYDEVEGVNIYYYIMDGWRTLHLENKDSSWQPIDDDYYADFSWNPCCPNLDWTLEGTFAASTEYVLIYYADQPDRYVNWGGAPALELATFTSNADGAFSESGIQNLGACLPYETDWNIGPNADYTQLPDNYKHGKGAKIWLILASDYNGVDKVLTGWHPDSYLFETDLIAYFDCDINPIPKYLFPYFEDEEDTLGPPYVLQPGEEICLFIVYNFDVAIVPGTYTITTKVVPTST